MGTRRRMSRGGEVDPAAVLASPGPANLFNNQLKGGIDWKSIRKPRGGKEGGEEKGESGEEENDEE